MRPRKTYSEFLVMLHDKGAEFDVNSSFLIVAELGTQLGME